MGAWVSPPQESTSHIVAVAASIAQAASTALPPRSNMRAPAVAASGLPGIAIQCVPCSGGFCVFCCASALPVANSARMAAAAVERMAGVMVVTSDQVLDPVALLEKLPVRRVHALAAELVDREPLHHGVAAVLAGDGVRVDDAIGDAVAAVGRHAHADPVAIVRAERPVAHVVD